LAWRNIQLEAIMSQKQPQQQPQQQQPLQKGSATVPLATGKRGTVAASAANDKISNTNGNPTLTVTQVASKQQQQQLLQIKQVQRLHKIKEATATIQLPTQHQQIVELQKKQEALQKQKQLIQQQNQQIEALKQQKQMEALRTEQQLITEKKIAEAWKLTKEQEQRRQIELLKQQQETLKKQQLQRRATASVPTPAPIASTLVLDVCVLSSPLFGPPLAPAQMKLFKLLSASDGELVQHIELFKFQERQRIANEPTNSHSTLASLYITSAQNKAHINRTNIMSVFGLRCKCCCDDEVSSINAFSHVNTIQKMTAGNGQIIPAPVYLCINSAQFASALQSLALHSKSTCHKITQDVRNRIKGTIPINTTQQHFGTLAMSSFASWFSKAYQLFPHEQSTSTTTTTNPPAPPPPPSIVLPQPQIRSMIPIQPNHQAPTAEQQFQMQQQYQSGMSRWNPAPAVRGMVPQYQMQQQQQQQHQQRQLFMQQQQMLTVQAIAQRSSLSRQQQFLAQQQQQQQQQQHPTPKAKASVENNVMYCALDDAVSDGFQDQFYGRLLNRKETIVSDLNLLPWSYFEVESPFLVYALECLELVRTRSHQDYENNNTKKTNTTTTTTMMTKTDEPSTLIIRCRFCHGKQPLDIAGRTQRYNWIVMNKVISDQGAELVQATASLHVFAYQHIKSCTCVPTKIQKRLGFVTPPNTSDDFKANAVHLHRRLKEWAVWIKKNYIEPYQSSSSEMPSSLSSSSAKDVEEEQQKQKEQEKENKQVGGRPVSPVTIKSPDIGIRVPLTGKLLRRHDVNPSPSVSTSGMTQATYKKYLVERPLNKNDVVFGLTPMEEEFGTPKALVGNSRFRNLISECRKDYLLAVTTKQRKDIVRSIVETIRRRGGFLRCLDDMGRLHKLTVGKAIEISTTILEKGHDVMQMPINTHHKGRGSRVLQLEVAPHYDVMDGTVHYDNNFDPVKIRSIVDPQKKDSTERKDHPFLPSKTDNKIKNGDEKRKDHKSKN